jgi:hypothetical protein
MMLENTAGGAKPLDPGGNNTGRLMTMGFVGAFHNIVQYLSQVNCSSHTRVTPELHHCCSARDDIVDDGHR